MGVYQGDRIAVSDPIQLTNEEVSPRSYFLPDEAVLFTDSYTYSTISLPGRESAITQVTLPHSITLFLSIDSL